MIILIAYIIVGVVYLAAPTKLKLVLLVINVLVPDPLPFIDEILMFLALVKGE